MIILSKLNGEHVGINPYQIEFIEQIPESKINMMNGKYHIVSENLEEIRQKIIEFYREAFRELKMEVL